jgi:hypothetical protein
MQKYPWLKCDEVYLFVDKMQNDLQLIQNIITAQERQINCLKFANAKLHRYIEVNRIADEVLIDQIRDQYKIDI